MLTVPHTVTGAALGSLVQGLPGGPVIAFGLGWASHYFLDRIPHWENWMGRDPQGFDTAAPLKQWPRSFVVSGVIDVLVSVSLFLLLFKFYGQTPFYLSPIFWGAIGGVLPDLLDNMPVLNHVTIKLPLVARERRYHGRVHISSEARQNVPHLAGLLTQVATIVIGLWVLALSS